MDEKTRYLTSVEIEKAIEGFPSIKNMLENTGFVNKWNLKNKHDFALGWALGSIQGGFILHCKQYPPSDKEESELIAMLKKKIKEMEDFYNAI